MLLLYYFSALNKRLLPVWLLLGLSASTTLYSQGNCQCTNCPQFMQDNFVGSFLINVQNAANPTLGQNGQGVCGVNISFNHEYIGDLSITLTSPGGQSVTLVGPIGLFGETDGSEWNVSFVPCGAAADPDPGFSAQWNNNQPWGLGGSYSGSYYPSSGCLENFNSGPVNGTWSLTVVDGQANDVGNFLDYEIIFCDPSGIDCFSCAANAGELLQPDVSACEGSGLLALNLPPTYTPPATAPPQPEYGYTYVIGGLGGVIQDYAPSPDLSSYPPGTYTVCGMSYLAAQEDLIPPPNGALTVTQLRNMLNSGTAPFCGKVTNNCVNVIINVAPDDIETFAEICAPDCYVFNGVPRCATGTYVANLTQNGCAYTSTLYLTVSQPKITNLTEYICADGCSVNPAFPNTCGAGGYTEKLTTYLGCDSTINLTLIELAATAVISNNPTIPCGGGTVQLSGNGSSTGGGYTYLWTASNGGNIVGSPTGINVNVNAAGTYELKVCRSQSGVTCCDSAEVVLDASTQVPNAPALISGLANVCQGQSFNYSIAPVSGASSYTWTVPSGGTLNTGGTGLNNNITWTGGPMGEVCVTANNGCGPSDPTCLNVNIGATPVATVPQGNTTVCAAVNGTYSIPAVANATGYAWTVSAPAQILSGQGTNSVQVAWNGATSVSLCVTASNSCGTSTQQCLPITVTSAPTAPVVSGANTACSQAVESYTIAAINGATNYNWTVTGGTITAGQGTTSIQVTWNTGVSAGTVCVQAQNTCGNSTNTCYNVALSAPPAAPTISGNNTLCPGDTAVYTASAVAGALGYTWTVPAGATIIAGQGSASATIVFGAAPGGNVSVAVNGGCGTAPQVNYPVTVNPTPPANAGTDFAPCGNNTALSASGNGGVWTQVSGPGTASFANPTQTNTNVTVSQVGTYVFQWAVNVAGCTNQDQVSVNFVSVPVAGVPTIVCDAANENYTVSFTITGGLAPYTVTGGTVTNGVFTSTPIMSGLPYQFTIVDANNCSSSPLQGSHNCNCSTSAGSMSQQPLQACGSATVTAVQVTPPTLDGNDVGVFVLHQGSGSTLVGPIAQNTTGVFAFQAGMTYGQTYYISFVAGNNMGGTPSAQDPCLAVAQGQPVTFYAIPVADAGTVQETCGTSITLNATGTGAWTVATAPAGGSAQFANANSPTSVVTTAVFGTYTLTWTVTENGCVATDQTQVSFHPSPQVANIVRTCDPTNQTFTVQFDLSNGTAPYIIDGATIAGNTYTSAPFNSGDSYTLTVSDSEGCTTTAVAGAYACSCTTDAGTMSDVLLKACVTQTVQATANPDAVLDANDGAFFIMHNGSGPALGSMIFDQNQTGIFGWVGAMNLDQIYYISRVVGTLVNGLANPNDPCYSVAPGQPVMFLGEPVANAGPDASLCDNAVALEAIPSIYPGAWSAAPGVNITDPANANTQINAVQAGTYPLYWTVTNDICVDVDTVVVTFYAIPQATVLAETCNSTNTQYTVDISVTNGTAPYTVSGLGGSVAGNLFTSSPITNGTAYSVIVTDANGCTVGPLQGVRNCDCATDAGTMSNQPLKACAGQTVQANANTDLNLDGDDVASFILHDGAGSLAGTIFDQNNTGVFSLLPNMTVGQTYYISRVAGNGAAGLADPNDPCYSVAIGQPVVFLEVPQPDAGPDVSACGNAATLDAPATAFSGQWTFVNGPVTANIATPTSPNATVSATQAGIYTFRWTLTNDICTGADEMEVELFPLPTATVTAENCNATNTQYTIEVTLADGTAPYTVSGLNGTTSGTTFTSVPVGSTTSYSFTVTDANGCTVGPIVGVENCNCSTDAGTMDTAPLTFCANTPATAVWNNDGQLDGDDVLIYVLHTGAGLNLGQILAQSNTPSFNFGGSLVVGQTYYISPVAGNGLNGLVDPNDPCLSVGAGTPVQWKPMPTATITGTATICEGSDTPISFQGTGTYPLTLEWTDGAGQSQSLLVADPQSVQVPVAPTATTVYTLVSVSDGTLPTCTTDINTTATVTVNTPVDAGMPLAAVERCMDASETFVLADLLEGEDTGGTWVEVSAVPSTGGAFNGAAGTFNTQGQVAGAYQFRYNVAALAPCTPAAATVTVLLRPLPTVELGPDAVVDCNNPTLDLIAQTSSSNITFAWGMDGAAVAGADQQQLQVDTGGLYQVTVTNSFGCTNTDQLTVVSRFETPVIELVAEKDISCYGQNDGTLEVVSVTGGTGPYLYSLNGAAAGQQTQFGPLAPGNYTLEVTDVNGCTTVKTDITLEEPPLLLADLGADLLVKLGDSLSVSAQINADMSQIDTIIWTPLMDSLNAGSVVQHFFPQRDGGIGVFVRDTNGCKTEDYLLYGVDRRRHIYVPNIFYPEGSENNTAIIFGGNDVLSIQYFRIFDRWGNMVHEATNFQAGDLTKGWKGTIDNKLAQPAVFVWVAAVVFKDGEIEVFGGDVTVSR